MGHPREGGHDGLAMDTYLVRLKPLSPYLTPWRSCTLWGRLTWIVRNLNERGDLPEWPIDTWIEHYREGLYPLVVGDAFPEDAVPVPAIFHARPQNGVKVPKSLPWKDWKALCREGKVPEAEERKAVRAERMHVVMDRDTGRATDGGLRTEIGFQPDTLIFLAQVDTSLGKQGLELLVNVLCQEGWGQGRTYGYGQVELVEIEDLPPPAHGTHFVTLGHCHPNGDLPTDGYWRFRGVPVRPHGPGDRKGESQYFTTMLEAGAIFEGNADNGYVGTIVPQKMPNNDAYLHYGLAPTWSIVFRGDQP